MTKKQVAIVIIFLISMLFLFFSLKNTLLSYLKVIEKNQKEIITELKKLNKNDSKIKTSDFTNSQELKKIKDEIKRLKSEVENQTDVLGLYDITPIASTSPAYELNSSSSYVTIFDRKWQTVDVFQEKLSSSKIIGQMTYGKTYPYSKKENGFYYIEYLDNKYGWVNQQFVREL